MISVPDPLRTLWENDNGGISVIDQKKLPHELSIVDLSTSDAAVQAIKEMTVRGAPLIGATAAYGLHFLFKEACTQDKLEEYIANGFQKMAESRPTAVNLFWAIDQIKRSTNDLGPKTAVQRSLEVARKIVEEDVNTCESIGKQGLSLVQSIFDKTQSTVNILTHCNAGMLGCIEWGTATSVIYHAHNAGIPVHVWVDETRPRNQGGFLTAWELGRHGVEHTVIVDNAGGHLMQHGLVDLVIVGTDRTTRTGDVANKIGTYLKALAAKDNNVPFYVALPSTSIDWEISSGINEIEIEERNPVEVTHIQGLSEKGELESVRLTPKDSPARNFGFDVTPSHLVNKLITERGICDASESGLLSLFPEYETRSIEY